MMGSKLVALPEEHIIKTFWPSIAAYKLGRWLGRVWQQAVSRGPLFSFLVGFVLAPLAGILYFWRLRPGGARRYVITDRRVIICEGIIPREVVSIGWEEVDRIEMRPQPGQAAFRAADVAFLRDGQVALLLPGVWLAENFVRICEHTRLACVSIQAERQKKAS